MNQKTKLIATLMSMCLVLALGVIGILAVRTLNMKIGGNITFNAEGIAFTVGEGKFYEDDATTLYTGISSQTGKMQGFSMDTDTKLTDVSAAIATWTDLELGLDNRGDSILKFNVSNDMDDSDLNIIFIVVYGENINENMEIVSSTTETIAGGSNKNISIKFDICDMNINAGIEDFEIKLTFTKNIEVTSQGIVTNQTNSMFTNVKYNLNTSNYTATAEAASSSISGETVIMDKVYVGTTAYTVKEIAEMGFELCHITTVVIAEGITIIGRNAFDGCDYLERIQIPNTVTSIGISAFPDCYKLERIKLPSELTIINDNMLSCCEILAKIEIPANVTKIGADAFYACESLTSITIYSTTPPVLVEPDYSNYFNYAFNETNNCPIYVPSASVNAYKSAWTLYADRIFAI